MRINCYKETSARLPENGPGDRRMYVFFYLQDMGAGYGRGDMKRRVRSLALPQAASKEMATTFSSRCTE